ncbi:MAG: hypothetical protein KIS92_03215 [Planctomycetota bacterium]|nr:hypothetical protein [Planctomycetota bacterium]
MIRLSANLSRKVPMPGVQFSSQQYGAALEIEVSDADKPEAIQARIRELYDMLNRSIDEQINAATAANGQQAAPEEGNAAAPGGNGQPKTQQAPRTGRTSQPRAQYRRNGNGQGNGRRPVGATQAQQRAIYAICKEQGIELTDVLADFNVAELSELNVMDASRLIDDLKSRSA